MLRTYRAVFPTVAIHPVLDAGGDDLESVRNIILVAGEGAAPSKEFLLERWREVRRRARARPTCDGDQRPRRRARPDRRTCRC